MSSTICLRYSLQTGHENSYWLYYNLHSGLILEYHLGQRSADHDLSVETSLQHFGIAHQ